MHRASSPAPRGRGTDPREASSERSSVGRGGRRPRLLLAAAALSLSFPAFPATSTAGPKGVGGVAPDVDGEEFDDDDAVDGGFGLLLGGGRLTARAMARPPRRRSGGGAPLSLWRGTGPALLRRIGASASS